MRKNATNPQNTVDPIVWISSVSRKMSTRRFSCTMTQYDSTASSQQTHGCAPNVSTILGSLLLRALQALATASSMPSANQSRKPFSRQFTREGASQSPRCAAAGSKSPNANVRLTIPTR